MSNAVLKGNASGTGTVTLETPNTNSDFTISLPAANGSVILAGTTPTLNGITFPATAVPSADANTLDDYEEGTWTPVINSFTVNSGTFTGTGKYTKIGNLVTVRMIQTGGNISWTGGSSHISGLPFAPDEGLGGAGSYTNGAPNIQGSVLSYRTGGGAGNLWMASSQTSQTNLTITATYFI
jgi:hypothetical protein